PGGAPDRGRPDGVAPRRRARPSHPSAGHASLIAMAFDAVTPIEARLYRAALRLCPDAFRRDHGDEMMCDFDDARSEAAASGARAVWAFRLLVAADLGRTLVVQWLRTGLPVIGCTAAIV